MKLLLALFISLSIRSAKIQPNPEDYEIAVGYKSANSNFELEWERQNGLPYFNCYLKSPRLSYYNFDLGIDITYDSVRQIDRQVISIVRDFNWFYLGGAIETQRWSNLQPAVTGGIKIKHSNLLLRVAVNRFYLEGNCGYKFPLRDKFFIEPFYKLIVTETSANWQSKILIGANLEF